MTETEFLGAVQALQQAGVDFILVGGLAAVLHGAPIQTFDVDAVYSREPSNITRLLTVMESLDAVFRLQPHRKLRPNSSHLSGSGHLNLQTRFGPLDLLATIGSNLEYADLLPLSSEMAISEALSIRVLNLETIIQIKEELASPKDLAALPVLRETLKLKSETGQ